MHIPYILGLMSESLLQQPKVEILLAEKVDFTG